MKEPFERSRRTDPARLLPIIMLWLSTAAGFLVFFDRTAYLRLTHNWIFFLLAGISCIILCFRSPLRGLYLLGPAFLLWLVFSVLLKGDSSLGQLAAQTPMVEQCIIFCLAFPFAHLIRDRQRRHLDQLLLVVVSIMGVLIWLCLIGIFTGQNISLLHNRLVFGASYTVTGRLKLKVVHLHYYHLGYLSVICFFITLYLAASHPENRYRPLWTLLLPTFAVTVLLTYSRNAVMALFLGSLMALWLFLKRMFHRKAVRRVLFCCFAAAGGLLCCTALNAVYRAVRSIRNVWYALDTLSSRTVIWAGGLRAIISQPQALLTGFPLETGMDTVNGFIPLDEPVSHMHSGFLEMLICFGLPGLILLLLFTVLILKRGFGLFTAAGEKSDVRLLTLIPFAITLMNVFDCLFPFESRVPLLIPLLHALISGYIVEIGCQFSLRTGSGTAKEPPLPG